MLQDLRHVQVASDQLRATQHHRPPMPASGGTVASLPDREPLLQRAPCSPMGQATVLAKADRAARSRIAVELQRTYGNVYVQRVAGEARRLTKPPASVRIQRCGAKPCNYSPEEEQAHAPTLAIQRTIGDGHDLTSPRFAGDPVLEACLDNEHLLKKGASGTPVQKVQEVLIELGHALPKFGADGSFGDETKTAVQKFQLKSGLPFSQADGIIGPVTMELLDTHAPGGGGPGPKPKPQVAGGCAPTPCPAGTAQGAGRCCLRGTTPPPLIYDTCAVQITPLPPGKTTAEVQAEIDTGRAATPPELTASSVTGVTPGTREETFVLDTLRQLARRDRWCTEIDVVAQIGQPDNQGNVPSGQVTVQIDSAGNAVADLVSRGKLKETAIDEFFETEDPAFLAFIEQLKRLSILRLMTTFKLSGVKEEKGRAWKIGELHKVETALARVKAEDVVALEGVDLIRTDTIVDAAGRELSGLFSHESRVAAGATSASRSASIRLADKAFEGDKVSFVGDDTGAAPGSFQTILHEVGHAVETKAQRDATFAEHEATAKLNEATQANNAAIANFNSAAQAAGTKAQGYSQPQQQAMLAYHNAFNAATTALTSLSQSQTAAQAAPRQTAAQQAITNRDTQRTALQTSSPNHPALTDFAVADTRQNEWFETAKARVVRLAALEQAQAARTQTEVTSGGRSRRLQNFVDFVTLNRIDPLTDYARDTWPTQPEEFFAEAYGLWLNDPTYLQTNAPLLFNWFEQGQHRA